MKVLITGASGYLGGRLHGFLDTFGRYSLRMGTRSRAWHANADGPSETATTDWASRSSLRTACEGIDAVVHLAGMSAPDCQRDPTGALTVNGVHTSRLLAAACDMGVDRFIYTSTVHVYGELSGVVTEATCPRGTHPYATSNRAGEDVVIGASLRGEIEGIVVRLSNVFGVPADPGTDCWSLVANDLCRQAATKRRLVLTSPGVQRRDFVAAGQATQALRHLLEVPLDRGCAGTYNVGGEWSATILQLAHRISDRAEATLGVRPTINAPSLTNGDITTGFEYSIEALRDTGFELPDLIDDELDKLLLYSRDRFAATP